MQSGRVFADARGNVVFRLRDEAGQEVGYEVRGYLREALPLRAWRKGTLHHQGGSTTRSAAFVESGIEALSYRALRGAGLILSTTGSAIEKPATWRGGCKREAMRSSLRLMPIRAETAWPSACMNSSAVA